MIGSDRRAIIGRLINPGWDQTVPDVTDSRLDDFQPRKLSGLATISSPFGTATCFAAPESPEAATSFYGCVVTMSLKSSFRSGVMISGGNGFCLKSKQSNISRASASRPVNGFKPNRFSINFSGEVKSKRVWMTLPALE